MGKPESQRARTGSRVAIAVLVLIAIATHLQWFNPFSILTFGDWQFRPDAHVAQLFTAWNTWISFIGLGEANILISGFPLRGMFWPLIANLGLTYDIATKLSLFIPIAIGSFLAPYALVRYWTRSTAISFVAALFYGSTAYLLVTQTAHLPIAFVYALLPILVLVLDKALRHNKGRHWVLLSLLFSLGVYYEVRLMLIVAVLLLLYFAYYVLLHRTGFVRYLTHIAIAAGLALLLNIFWIIPTIAASTDDISEVARRGVFGNHLFDLAHSFAIAKWDWTGGLVDRTFTLQTVPALLWAVPIVAMSGLLLRTRYTAHVLFFLGVSLLGIFLTKQASEPFGSVYQWLYDNLPGFVLFREASKFYLITAFGYLGMLAYTFMSWRTFQRMGGGRLALHDLGLLVVAIVAIINLLPAATTSIGGTFKAAHKPHDYELLDNFLAEQEQFSRTLWYPRVAWWGYYSNNHPRVSAVDVMQDEWREYGFDSLTADVTERPEQILSLLDAPYAQYLLNKSSIQYVIVPVRDTANDADVFADYGDKRDVYIERLDQVPFLDRVDIGADELAIYENKSYHPPLTASANLIGISNYGQLAGIHGFLHDIGIGSPNFYLSDDNPLGTPHAKSLFDNLTVERDGNGMVLRDSFTPPSNTKAKVYKNTAAAHLGYRTTDTSFTLYEIQPTGLHLNDAPLHPPQDVSERLLYETALPPNAQHYIELDGVLLPLEPGTEQHLSNTDTLQEIRLHVEGGNAISNPSFDTGLWKERVEDCHNYDDNADIHMLSVPTRHGLSVQLEATRHTACTSTTFPVAGGEYVLNFDYESPDTGKAGYFIHFDDADGTTVSKQLSIVQPDQWQTHAARVTVPEGATSATLSVYAYESDKTTTNIIRYDNFSFNQPRLVDTIRPPHVMDNFEPVEVTLRPGQNDFTLRASDYSGNNLISNASFEDGMWQEQVSDCHNYDDHGKLNMKLSEHAAQGQHSLQLEATRHNACTGIDIALDGPGYHLFSFNVSGVRAKRAGYHLRFNDPHDTVITERFNLERPGEWQQFKKKIQVPVSATRAHLTLYAYEPDGATASIVRYDNTALVSVPDMADTYYVLTEPETVLRAPEQIVYRSDNPTKKTVTITGASGPFALNFAESFHAGWHLYPAPVEACDPVYTYQPPAGQAAASVAQCASTNSFALGDMRYLAQTPLTDSPHIKLNGFANGWIIDPERIKAAYGPEYYTEHPDGSIDMRIVVYYQPQSYFYAGLIVSGVALAGSFAYLIWGAIRRRRAHSASADSPRGGAK